MELINKIFTTEDKNELKQGFKEIILKQFESDLQQMDVYLFDPSEIEEMITESFEDVIKEAKVDFKERLKSQITNLLETNDIERLLGFSKKKK